MDARHRRKRLPKLARDVERCLGRAPLHPDAASAPELHASLLGLSAAAPSAEV
ncbi:MAG: hypothetical protein M5U28_19365 [Sandaracinaceae bacterium]|nr:hypothetical protein [Sandaracinaceae bacterium]